MSILLVAATPWLARGLEPGSEGAPGAEPKHEFVSPGPKDFDLPPFFESVAWFTKPVLIVALATIAVFLFYFLAARKAAVVPLSLIHI